MTGPALDVAIRYLPDGGIDFVLTDPTTGAVVADTGADAAEEN